MWEINDYFELRVTVFEEWNCDYYTNTDSYPNYDIKGVTIRHTFTEIEREKMVFEATTASSALSAWRKSLDLDDERKVDPDTGLDEDGHWFGAFHDTSDFEDGYEVSGIELLLEYEDDSGIHSRSKIWKVVGDKIDIELEIDGNTETIDAWNLTIDDFDIDYTLDDLEFRTENKDLYMRVSNINGIFLGETGTIIIKLKTNDGYVTLLTSSYTSEVYRIQGVKVDGDGALIPGFQFSIIIITPMIVLVLRKSKIRWI